MSDENGEAYYEYMPDYSKPKIKSDLITKKVKLELELLLRKNKINFHIPEIWEDKKGNKILFKNMKNDYIQNCVKLLNKLLSYED